VGDFEVHAVVFISSRALQQQVVDHLHIVVDHRRRQPLLDMSACLPVEGDAVNLVGIVMLLDLLDLATAIGCSCPETDP
jgi:hypothetical protein